MRPAAGHARLDYGRAAVRAGLARAGKDLQVVLVLAGLAERVVVGVEGGAPELDGPAQDVARRGVDGLYLPGAQGVRLARRVDASGEEHLVHVDVAEARDHRLVEEEPF